MGRVGAGVAHAGVRGADVLVQTLLMGHAATGNLQVFALAVCAVVGGARMAVVTN